MDQPARAPCRMYSRHMHAVRGRDFINQALGLVLVHYRAAQIESTDYIEPLIRTSLLTPGLTPYLPFWISSPMSKSGPPSKWRVPESKNRISVFSISTPSTKA